jgi:hypothetical protein
VRNIGSRAGVEVIDAQHVVALHHEPLAQIRAEETCAADS